VLNNPLSYTDPSGYFFKKLFKTINKALGDLAPIVAIGLAFLGQTWAAQGIWQAATLGFVSGGVATGSIKGALVGAFSGAAFFQIGAHFTGALEGGFGHVMAHGITGGLSSVLQGGKFGHGFVSAGLTKMLNVNKMIGTAAKDAGARIVTAAVIGGTISRITGGKFANGAITAAFAQSLNGETAAEAEERYKNAAAFVQNEIHDDALSRRNELGKLMKDENWSEIKKLYPHLSEVSENSMHIEALNLHQEFHYIAGRTLSGKVLYELDASFGKGIRFTIDLAIDKTPKGIIGAFIGLLYSPPPPVQHKFIYQQHRVDIEIEMRRYD
jgi:hypothetical protein